MNSRDRFYSLVYGVDNQYSLLITKIMNQGFDYEDPNRKGVMRRQIDSHKLEFDFEHGFPIVSLKHTSFKTAVGEFVTFMNGKNTLKALHENGVKFWDKDVERYGYRNLGQIYPILMREWESGIFRKDQISNLLVTLLETPYATKKTVTMWNPAHDDSIRALSPCHWAFEALVSPEGLRIKYHQHSVDVFLGLPYNLVYYSLMCYVLGKATGLKPLGIIADLSNVHIYHIHFDAVEEFEKRENKLNISKVELRMTQEETRDKILNKSLTVNDFELLDYISQPHIKAEMLTYNK